jgi:hypothetical protein
MVFQTLYDSYKRNELIMLDGAFARYRKKKDGSIVLYEIFSNGNGQGRKIIDMLLERTDTYVMLKCPETEEANNFYHHLGFVCIDKYVTKNGTVLKVWRKEKCLD